MLCSVNHWFVVEEVVQLDAAAQPAMRDTAAVQGADQPADVTVNGAVTDTPQVIRGPVSTCFVLS